MHQKWMMVAMTAYYKKEVGEWKEQRILYIRIGG